MANLTEVTGSNFEIVVQYSEIPVLVLFWASWSPTSLKLRQIIGSIVSKYEGRIKFVEIDTANDSNRGIIDQYQVKDIPCTLFLKDRAENGKIIGPTTLAKIEAEIQRLL